MSTVPRQWHERLFHRVGNPLEWSEVDKVTVAAAIAAPIATVSMLANRMLANLPGVMVYVNAETLGLMLRWIVGLSIGYWLILAVGLFLRRRTEKSLLLVLAISQLTFFGLGVMSRYAEPFTLPCWISALAGAYLTYVFFSLWIALVGLVVFFAVMEGVAVAVMLGWLPYRSLLAGPPYILPPFADMWMIRIEPFNIAFVFVCIAIVAYTVGYWRHQNKELQHALSEKDRTHEKLIRMESLAALGESLAGIMHDLRNPVAGVASVVEEVIGELRAKDAEKFSDQISDLEFSLKQQRRAGDFIRSLLDLSRKTDGYNESVDVNKVVLDSLEVLRVQFRREGAQFETVLAKDLPSVRGNFAQLGQVILNLGRNAVEALEGRSGGRIMLETALADGRLEIRCRDNGPGIPEDALPRVFDSFFTTKAAGSGTGLGLYLAHQIVGRHGGTLLAGNDPAGGALFTIRLPLTLQSNFPARGEGIS